MKNSYLWLYYVARSSSVVDTILYGVAFNAPKCWPSVIERPPNGQSHTQFVKFLNHENMESGVCKGECVLRTVWGGVGDDLDDQLMVPRIVGME